MFNPIPSNKRAASWVIHLTGVTTLTAIQLVSNDDEESDTSPKGVDGNGDFTCDSCYFPTGGSDDLLIGAFITDLKRAKGSLQPHSGVARSSWGRNTREKKRVLRFRRLQNILEEDERERKQNSERCIGRLFRKSEADAADSVAQTWQQ